LYSTPAPHLSSVLMFSVCVCEYLYIYTYIDVHINSDVYIHTGIYAHIYKRTRAFFFTNMGYACDVLVRVFVRVCPREKYSTYMYMYMYTYFVYVYAYIFLMFCVYVCIYIYVYTFTSVDVLCKYMLTYVLCFEYIYVYTLIERNPPPGGGFPIYYVPSSRTVPHQEPWEDPPRRICTRFFRGVLFHTVLDEGT